MNDAKISPFLIAGGDSKKTSSDGDIPGRYKSLLSTGTGKMMLILLEHFVADLTYRIFNFEFWLM